MIRKTISKQPQRAVIINKAGRCPALRVRGNLMGIRYRLSPISAQSNWKGRLPFVIIAFGRTLSGGLTEIASRKQAVVRAALNNTEIAQSAVWVAGSSGESG